MGFVVEKAAKVQVFSEYFGLPCQAFHRLLHNHNNNNNNNNNHHHHHSGLVQ
jgi:hypothetical protein